MPSNRDVRILTAEELATIRERVGETADYSTAEHLRAERDVEPVHNAWQRLGWISFVQPLLDHAEALASSSDNGEERGEPFLGKPLWGSDESPCCDGGTVAECKARGETRACTQWHGKDAPIIGAKRIASALAYTSRSGEIPDAERTAPPEQRPVPVSPSGSGEPVDQMRALLDADRALRQKRPESAYAAGAFKGAVTHSGAAWLSALNDLGHVIARSSGSGESERPAESRLHEWAKARERDLDAWCEPYDTEDPKWHVSVAGDPTIATGDTFEAACALLLSIIAPDTSQELPLATVLPDPGGPAEPAASGGQSQIKTTTPPIPVPDDEKTESRDEQ